MKFLAKTVMANEDKYLYNKLYDYCVNMQNDYYARTIVAEYCILMRKPVPYTDWIDALEENNKITGYLYNFYDSESEDIEQLDTLLNEVGLEVNRDSFNFDDSYFYIDKQNRELKSTDEITDFAELGDIVDYMIENHYTFGHSDISKILFE